MVVIFCAYTEPINPTGESPTLSRDQIWRGLQRKIRKAQDFVPVITSTNVLEDKGNEVIREAYFKGSAGVEPHTVRERCMSYYPTRVDFHQPNGAVISNTISDGHSLTESDYNMTYTFEWRYPDILDGSEEHTKKMEESLKDAQRAVHSSIVAMRKMAANGELD